MRHYFLEMVLPSIYGELYNYLDILSCPRELRFPTIKGFSRDSEIARTSPVSNYFYASP